MEFTKVLSRVEIGRKFDVALSAQDIRSFSSSLGVISALRRDEVYDVTHVFVLGGRLVLGGAHLGIDKYGVGAR